MTWLKSLGAKLITILILGAVVLGLAVFALSQWRSAHTAKTEARLEKGEAKAAIGAGEEAMNTIANVAAADAAADQIHEEGINAIRNAPEGKRGDAALAASCKLRHNAGKARCAALRKAGAGDAAPSG